MTPQRTARRIIRGAMPRRDLLPPLAVAVLLSLLATGALVLGATPELLLAAPVLVMVLPLLAGRYVGEERIARLRAAAPQGPRRPVAGAVPAVRATLALVPRGGRLIAASLAVRPPPHALST
jgi:hypothetical protein